MEGIQPTNSASSSTSNTEPIILQPKHAVLLPKVVIESIRKQTQHIVNLQFYLANVRSEEASLKNDMRNNKYPKDITAQVLKQNIEAVDPAKANELLKVLTEVRISSLNNKKDTTTLKIDAEKAALERLKLAISSNVQIQQAFDDEVRLQTSNLFMTYNAKIHQDKQNKLLKKEKFEKEKLENETIKAITVKDYNTLITKVNQLQIQLKSKKKQSAQTSSKQPAAGKSKNVTKNAKGKKQQRNVSSPKNKVSKSDSKRKANASSDTESRIKLGGKRTRNTAALKTKD